MRRQYRDGTRFRLYPQYAEGYAEPETVVLSPPAGSLGPGPSDAAMYVADAVDKASPYDPPGYMPPYDRAEFPPAKPDADGHFDRIPTDAPEFLAAHVFGTVRRTLDLWEAYLGNPVRWWHASFLPQLELVPVVDWANAQSGPGFLETGVEAADDGTVAPFALNFDVIAHETGHAILFSQIGVPEPAAIDGQFLAFHESFSDLVALVAGLHFRSVTERLLAETGGNLYILNLVSRIGEISSHQQIRIASNTTTMADVADLRLGPDGQWIDPTGQGRNAHWLAQPLTGAVFDVLAEIFQDGLVSRGLIAPDDDPRGWTREEIAASLVQVQHATGRALAAFTDGFFAALHDARDVIGASMAHVMHTVAPQNFSFDEVAARFIDGALQHVRADLAPALIGHFLAHEIDPRRFLRLVPVRLQAGAQPRFNRPVQLRAVPPRPDCGCADPDAFILAHRLMPHPHRAAIRHRGRLQAISV